MQSAIILNNIYFCTRIIVARPVALFRIIENIIIIDTNILVDTFKYLNNPRYVKSVMK